MKAYPSSSDYQQTRLHNDTHELNIPVLPIYADLSGLNIAKFTAISGILQNAIFEVTGKNYI